VPCTLPAVAATPAVGRVTDAAVEVFDAGLLMSE